MWRSRRNHHPTGCSLAKMTIRRAARAETRNGRASPRWSPTGFQRCRQAKLEGRCCRACTVCRPSPTKASSRSWSRSIGSSADRRTQYCRYPLYDFHRSALREQIIDSYGRSPEHRSLSEGQAGHVQYGRIDIFAAVAGFAARHLSLARTEHRAVVHAGRAWEAEPTSCSVAAHPPSPVPRHCPAESSARSFRSGSPAEPRATFRGQLAHAVTSLGSSDHAQRLRGAPRAAQRQSTEELVHTID